MAVLAIVVTLGECISWLREPLQLSEITQFDAEVLHFFRKTVPSSCSISSLTRSRVSDVKAFVDYVSVHSDMNFVTFNTLVTLCFFTNFTLVNEALWIWEISCNWSEWLFIGCVFFFAPDISWLKTFTTVDGASVTQFRQVRISDLSRQHKLLVPLVYRACQILGNAWSSASHVIEVVFPSWIIVALSTNCSAETRATVR
jgi:hypothetical protein